MSVQWLARCPDCGSDATWRATPTPTPTPGAQQISYVIDCPCGEGQPVTAVNLRPLARIIRRPLA